MKYVSKLDLFEAIRIPSLSEGYVEVTKFYQEVRDLGFPTKFETFMEELSTNTLHVKYFSEEQKRLITATSGDYIVKSKYMGDRFYFVAGESFEYAYQPVGEITIRHATGNGLKIKSTGDIEITGS